MLSRPATASETPAPAIGVDAVVQKQVAVVIAAWRATGTIGRAVASALAQPETAEVVVVDDCSGDDGATIAAARAADDGSGRLQVFALPSNSGPAAARNAAIQASKAPWIAILDSDDFLEPGRLGALLALSDKGYDFIADDLLQVPEGQPVSTGKPLWFETDKTPLDVSFGLFVDSNVIRADRHRRELGFLKPLCRRAFIEKHALAYDETLRLGEDYDLYARALSLGGRMHLIPWAGYVSIMRPNSLSLNHDRADLAAIEAADLRLLATGRLSPADAKLVRAHIYTNRSRITWIDVIDALKGRNPFRAAAILLKDPRQATHVLPGLFDILFRKITGAKRKV